MDTHTSPENHAPDLTPKSSGGVVGRAVRTLKKPSDYVRDRGAHYSVLRVEIAKLISNGIRSKNEILRILGNRRFAESVILGTLESLCSDSMVMRGRGGTYSLTTAGWDLAPRPYTLADAGTYRTPARPPMRPGADDWRRAPSVAAGIEREYQPHV